MIVGIGIDLVSIQRIGNKLGGSDALRDTIFAPAEIEYCEKAANKMQHYAARFAVKEAFLKAVGKGLLLGTTALREIEVYQNEEGRPFIKLHHNLNTLRITEGWTSIQVSVSHEGDMATAIVILEK
jgi:holo-[acyl-carrier protein] synthase